MKVLFLLAGYPATGKTYLADLICARFDDVKKITPDDIKVELWKKVGFKDEEEKNHLVDDSWLLYYDELTEAMSNGTTLISEYPFSGKQYNTLETLSDKYGYHVITVRLTAEFETLWQRHLERDVQGGRDVVYTVTKYDPLDPPLNDGTGDDIITRDIFLDRYNNKGYGEFVLGDLLIVDTTDFALVDYEDIITNLFKLTNV